MPLMLSMALPARLPDEDGLELRLLQDGLTLLSSTSPTSRTLSTLPPNKAFRDMARGVVLPKELVTEPERHTSDGWSTMDGVVTVPLCLDSLLSAASWLLEEEDLSLIHI